MLNNLKKIMVLITLISSPEILLAYGGPGVGLTAIGTFLSIIAAIFLAIIGFVWYPVKRLLNKILSKDKSTEDISE